MPRTMVLLYAVCYPEIYSRLNGRFPKGTVMPAAERVKAGKCGSAIAMLLDRGGAFQTRHQRTLIVNAGQKEALEQAGLIETTRLKQTSSKVANPIEATNRFFAGLKPILKTATYIEQQEILISRIECRLM